MQEVTDFIMDTFEDNGMLSRIIPNYKKRPQQVELASKIKECLEGKKHLLAEAPTGVGKSLASLVPAFEYIKKTDKAVIVVTSSIVLQEQYIQKDIPLLERLYGMDVSPILIKGRNNYVCPKKVQGVRNGNFGVGKSELIEEGMQVLDWALQTESGDKSELEFVPNHQIWAQFSCVEQNECTGKQCPFYNLCPYYNERSKVNSAKIVVCNYHYFFTAMEVGKAMLPESDFIIFDEGHEMNAIARDFQEKKYTYRSLNSQLDMLHKSMETLKYEDFGYPSRLIDDMELDMLSVSLNQMFMELNTEYKKEQKTRKSFLMIGIPARTRLQKVANSHINALQQAITSLEEYLAKYGFTFENIQSMADYYGEIVTDWFVVAANTSEFFTEKLDLLKFIFAYDEKQDDKNFIFWMQPYGEAVSVHAKPLDGSGLINPLFKSGEEEKTCIVMSATLTANQEFNHIKKDFGIDGARDQYPVDELIVSSPFNLNQNLLWYLPQDCPAGNEPDHLSFVLEEMKKVITEMNGRCLCLFTSKRNMLEAERYFNNELPKHINILSQDSTPKQKIIDSAKQQDSTVIIGTKSFFTGIDIQGHHLSAVLIDKLPFPMIGDPINDYLMNEPMGFYTFSLPEAIISLKQAFGRLNRTVTDKGIVAVYDGRLETARYKNRIFNSFDFKIQATKDWNVVKQYIRDLELPQ